MILAIYLIAAVCSYLISAINPAIELSKLIYHKDIRNEGSGNPGFTNFKRVFGSKYAWVVFLLDISKALVLEIIFGAIFQKYTGQRQFGIAFTGLFAMLGHAYPIWYKFKGGKAFLVIITTMYMVDWKAGLIATVVLALFLFTSHYMSLSTIIALFAGAFSLFFFKNDFTADSLGILTNQSAYYITIGTMIFSALFVAVRHKENIKNLLHGKERKFYFKSSRKNQTEDLKREN